MMDTIYGLMAGLIFGIVIGAAVVLLAQRSIPGSRRGTTRLHVGRNEPFLPPHIVTTIPTPERGAFKSPFVAAAAKEGEHDH